MYRKFRNTMVLHPDYKVWLQLVAGMIREEVEECYQDPVSVDITIYGGKGFPESADGDNCMKAVLDALKPKEFCGKVIGAGIIPDDCVNHVRSWGGKYYTRLEHWQCLHLPVVAPIPRAKDLAALEARCILRVVPHVTILEPLP